ncbi:hypothetical protein NDU88_002241 [Pleurodeles waltl]|uniref:Secreted protein n=1 Tax=Pleurodeles waltl TaxID=8319 RepID=A0AAV7WKN9_PLEWA|nr:hypothetical protein NDU88_002241 [Pleurodeles waltl]
MPSSASTVAPLLACQLGLARSLRLTQCVPSHSVRPLEYVSSCCFRALIRATDPDFLNRPSGAGNLRLRRSNKRAIVRVSCGRYGGRSSDEGRSMGEAVSVE